MPWWSREPVRAALGSASASWPTVVRGGPTIRVQTERTTRAAALAAAGLFAAVLLCGALSTAFAATPPHVMIDGRGGNTDSCAICHRAHTADAAVPFRTLESTETTGTSLLIASDPAAGDVSLCLSCHGAAQLGSNTDIQSRFLLSSVHGLAPATAAYGPSALYCSTCHDSHGDARMAAGTPYPRLLRSFEGTRAVYTGEAYCATCHTVAAAIKQGERWAGMDVYRLTAHYTGIAAPGSGTGIRCSVCHDPHGSAVAPLLAASLVPASVAATFTVTADDRTFCNACHGPAKASWEGTTTYATSSHGSSTATVAISAAWVPKGARRVGECQVCHAPMGRSDGSGGAISKLLEAKGRALCDRCHAPGAVRASTDTSTEAYPATESSAKELVAVYVPQAATAADGRVSVYGRALSGAAPRPLIGPKQYAPALGTGPSAAGNVDPYHVGAQLVVAAAGSARVSVHTSDELTGLALEPVTAAIPGGFKATSLAVANVVHNGAGVLPDTDEIVAITSDGRLVVYSWTGSALAVVGEVTLPAGPWGLATGDLTGTGFAKIVVTDASAGSVTIAGDDGSGGISATTALVGVSPVAPSIGRVWSTAPEGEQQIVVGDSASATATVRVLDASGAELGGYLVISGDGAPQATAVGNVLPGVSGAEVAIAFANASGDSSISIVPQIAPGPGLDIGVTSVVERATGVGFHTANLLVGDVEGDGRNELVTGSGGTWSRSTAAVAPSVQVWRANGAGTALAAPESYVAGGAEMAGAAPSLALADLGPVLPSRHPVDEVASAAHVSTETAPFARHVTCSDCHDSHVATRAAGVAPAVSGPMAGAWGVTATVTYPGPAVAFAAAGRSATGYGVCFKCHSSYAAPLGGRADLAVAFDPANASVHSVAQASTSTVAAGTFVTATPAWTAASVLSCTDCHGDDGRTADQARGPHTSASAPILLKPYAGVAPADAALLCYSCHRHDVYATGAADGTGMSAFVASGGTKRLHSVHVAASPTGHGVSCGACHVSHGSVTQPHLLRGDIGFASTGPDAGTCTNDCHDPAVGGSARSWPVL
jgi:predicted CXXCH cytochrome family protein